MKRSLQSLVVASLWLLAVVAGAQDQNFYVFLCFGQSNMDGFPAALEAADKTGVDARFQVLAAIDFPDMGRKQGQWYTAVPPLFRPGNGLSPMDYFGRTLVAKLPAAIKVGIVPVAVPGCKIELFDEGAYQAYVEKSPGWMKNFVALYGGNPFRHLVNLGLEAKKVGVIKGILMHQGESNTDDPEWPNKVKVIYERLLTELDLKAEDVPLIVGEVVAADQKGACAPMNRIIDSLPKTIPTAHVVSAAGCGARPPDNLHFSFEGYRLLGTRYGEAVFPLLRVQP